MSEAPPPLLPPPWKAAEGSGRMLAYSQIKVSHTKQQLFHCTYFCNCMCTMCTQYY